MSILQNRTFKAIIPMEHIFLHPVHLTIEWQKMIVKHIASKLDGVLDEAQGKSK